jgi:hypothetical protein
MKINRYCAKLNSPPDLFGLHRIERPAMPRKMTIAIPDCRDSEYGSKPVRRTSHARTKIKTKSTGLRLTLPIVKNQSGESRAPITIPTVSIFLRCGGEEVKTDESILYFVMWRHHHVIHYIRRVT